MNNPINPMLHSAFQRSAVIVSALMLALGGLQAAEYELVDHAINWSGSMPVKTHEGRLALKSIDVAITDEGKVTALKAVVDMTKIDVTDLEGKKRDKLTAHLESDDFFHVEKHPTATFVLDEHKEETFIGTLTIRGVSREVALPAKVSGHPDRGWMLVGSFNYNRNDFGVDYQNSGLLGFMNAAKSKLIDELIEVSVSVKLAPKA
ncbi:MAG: YceI family protein [Opitutales bacterium]